MTTSDCLLSLARRTWIKQSETESTAIDRRPFFLTRRVLTFIRTMELYIDSEDFVWSVSDDKRTEPCSKFDSLFHENWISAVEAGVCRYRLTALQTKVLPGKFGLVAQVNTDYNHNKAVVLNIVASKYLLMIKL